MTDAKKTKLLDALHKMQDTVNNYWETIDVLSYCDRPFSEALDEIQKSQPKGVKLKKKERKALLMKTLNEKMPEFVKTLDEFDLMMEAVELRIEESKDKLQDKLDGLDELEDLQNEIEERKRELDL